MRLKVLAFSLMCAAFIPNAAAEKPMCTVGFSASSAELTPEARGELDRLAERLRKNTRIHAVVEGFTDTSGKATTNAELSYERGFAVKRYLAERGVAPGRVDVRARGPVAPVASNATADGRARNRRVEVRVRQAPARGVAAR